MKNKWLDKAAVVVLSMGNEFWWSDLRKQISKKCGEPPHKNNWGLALYAKLSQAGYEKTIAARRSKIHSRNAAEEFLWIKKNFCGKTRNK